MGIYIAMHAIIDRAKKSDSFIEFTYRKLFGIFIVSTYFELQHIYKEKKQFNFK